MSRKILLGFSLILIGALVAPTFAQRKKKKDPEDERTQQLEVIPEPPAAVSAETARLGFMVSPLSAKGLLSQQTRDSLKALAKNARGAQIVKVRAFVAGTGDLRRVQTIVSEEFSDRKQSVPALSVIQVGLLPQEGAQVILEAVTQEKKPVNSNGVAFFSGQHVALESKAENPLQAIGPQLEKSLAGLRHAADSSGVPHTSMMRVTCFVSSLADHPSLAKQVAQTFPQAAAAIVQLQRGPLRPEVECEGVGRLGAAPSTPVHFDNPKGLSASPNYSQVAQVRAPRIVFTGTQAAYGASDDDVKLAFERLKRALESAKASYPQVFFTHFYPLTNSVIEKIRGQRFDYLDKSRPPASTLILFEGLPSLDATFAMEVVAAAN